MNNNEVEIKKVNNNAETRITKTSNSCFDKIKYFLNKDNFMILKLVIAIILSCLCSIILEYTVYRNIYVEYVSKLRMMIVAAGFMFVFIHFIFRLNKMYEFIHKYRYLLACRLFNYSDGT